MAARRTRGQSEAGFTLVEVMVAATILLVGLLATLTMIDQAQSTTLSTKAREGANAVQREIVEAARSVPYDQLTPNGIGPRIREKGALADSSLASPGWTIRRRGFTYTVSVGVCSVDDARDGFGNHDAGQFCVGGAGGTSVQECQTLLGATGVVSSSLAAATSSVTLGDCGIDVNLDGQVDGLVNASATVCIGTCAAGGVDQNPADYKRIVTMVSWDRGQGNRWALQATTVANPGLSAAPTVNALTTSRTLPITSAGVIDVPFTATTNITPASYVWYLDGTAQETVPGGLNAWNFIWSLGTVGGGSSPNDDEVLDGSYLVGARAFDTYGQPGQMRTVTVLLNRSAPYAPKHVMAGRSGGNVNIEWAPNLERDIVGYRVYRSQASGPWTEVCALTTKTSCQDGSPPAGAIDYQVVAVDRDPAGALREGARSATASIGLLTVNNPPTTPTGLKAVSSGGNTILTWTASTDPDAGDSVSHYVIYRDGTRYADRYDRTASGAVGYTDTQTNGLMHTYYVAAVDTKLAESPLSFGVTR